MDELFNINTVQTIKMKTLKRKKMKRRRDAYKNITSIFSSLRIQTQHNETISSSFFFQVTYLVYIINNRGVRSRDRLKNNNIKKSFFFFNKIVTALFLEFALQHKKYFLLFTRPGFDVFYDPTMDFSNRRLRRGKKESIKCEQRNINHCNHAGICTMTTNMCCGNKCGAPPPAP